MFKMTGRPQRTVVWEYPLEALREAVTNAVCHRDYLSSAHTQVRIYDDHLMVWNPGALPVGLSLDMLKRKHASMPRNRLIAQVFYYAGLIEQWGSGIDKMISEARNLGLPDPVFEEEGGFRVTFSNAAVHRPGGLISETSTPTPQVTPQASPQASAQILAILRACAGGPRSREQLQAIAGIRDRKHFRTAYL